MNKDFIWKNFCLLISCQLKYSVVKSKNFVIKIQLEKIFISILHSLSRGCSWKHTRVKIIASISDIGTFFSRCTVETKLTCMWLFRIDAARGTLSRFSLLHSGMDCKDTSSEDHKLV